MAEPFIVAVPGLGVVPSNTPLLHADDLGALRGDGVFETLHVRNGTPWLLDQHLARMAASAHRLDLTLPPAPTLADLATQACAAWTDQNPTDHEAALRLICTRGRESGGPPTIYATIKGLPPTHLATRRNGVAVLTATLGVAHDARPAAPWLLAGAKTLSYAVNMATQRWGAANGADDVLWVSSDGYALEAPTSTLVWLDDDTLCTIPTDTTGVLPGTTAAWLLANANTLGWSTAHRNIHPPHLAGTNGAWLTSSVRGAAAIRSIDGTPLPVSPHTGRILTLLGFPH